MLVGTQYCPGIWMFTNITPFSVKYIAALFSLFLIITFVTNSYSLHIYYIFITYSLYIAYPLRIEYPLHIHIYYKFITNISNVKPVVTQRKYFIRHFFNKCSIGAIMSPSIENNSMVLPREYPILETMLKKVKSAKLLSFYLETVNIFNFYS